MDLTSIKSSNKFNKRLANLIIANLFLIVTALAIVIASTLFDSLNTCVIKNATGIICPTCGGTRSLISLLRLDFISAFKYYPLLVIFFFYIIFVDIFIFVDSLKNKTEQKEFFRIDLVVYVSIVLMFVQYGIRLFYIFKQLDCPFMYLNL